MGLLCLNIAKAKPTTAMFLSGLRESWMPTPWESDANFSSLDEWWRLGLRIHPASPA